jgi:hypothetical protein
MSSISQLRSKGLKICMRIAKKKMKDLEIEFKTKIKMKDIGIELDGSDTANFQFDSSYGKNISNRTISDKRIARARPRGSS